MFLEGEGKHRQILDLLHISGEELEQKEEKQEKTEAEVTTEKSLAGDPFELIFFYQRSQKGSF